LASETRRNYRRIVLNFLLSLVAEIVFTALQADDNGRATSHYVGKANSLALLYVLTFVIVAPVA
jgi:hypothetical protein